MAARLKLRKDQHLCPQCEGVVEAPKVRITKKPVTLTTAIEVHDETCPSALRMKGKKK